ncbi:MAG TPA: hypothetical protein PLZ36_13365 [Armatimonadota bacterium]|nr:hypothetical protein [Armatimonadota bacterium]
MQRYDVIIQVQGRPVTLKGYVTLANAITQAARHRGFVVTSLGEDLVADYRPWPARLLWWARRPLAWIRWAGARVARWWKRYWSNDPTRWQ